MTIRKNHQLFVLMFFIFASFFMHNIAQAAPREDSPHVPWKIKQWRRIASTNFWVYFEKDNEASARTALQIFEKVHREISPQYSYKLRWRRTHVILKYRSNLKNALALPVDGIDQIILHMNQDARGEEVGYNENYLYNLFVHEYTHIVTLRSFDKKHPAQRVFRFFFGTPPRLLSPTGILEGIATWQEAQTGHGRPNSSYIKMLHRTVAITGNYPSIEEIYGGTHRWPLGSTPYTYGARFFEELQEQKTKKAIYDYWDGDTFGILTNFDVYKQNIRVKELYESMKRKDIALYTQQAKSIVTQGETAYVRLTKSGMYKSFLHITKEGKVLFSSQLDFKPSGIYELSADSGVVIRKSPRAIRRPSYVTGITSGGGKLIVSEPKVRYNDNQFPLAIDAREITDELWDGNRSFPYGRMARNRFITYPALSSDGKRLYFSERDTQRHYLKTVLLSEKNQILQSTEETIMDVPFYGFIQYVAVNPRNSNQFIALVRKGEFGAGGAIMLCNRNEEKQYKCSKIVKGNMDKIHGQFTRDGKSILFASDPDGIFNIYKYNIASRITWQLTRTTTGFLYPVEDDKGGIYSIRHFENGFDVVYINKNNLLREKVDYFGTEDYSLPQVPGLQIEDVGKSNKVYTSLMHFYAKGWILAITKYENFASYGIGARDALNRHSLDFDFNLYQVLETSRGRLASNSPKDIIAMGLGVDYSYKRFWVDFLLGYSHNIVNIPKDANGVTNFNPERTDTYRTATLGFILPQQKRNFNYSFAWGIQRAEIYNFNRFRLEDDINIYSIIWQAVDLYRYPGSISPENGYGLGLALRRVESLENEARPREYPVVASIFTFTPGLKKRHVNYLNISFEGVYGEGDARKDNPNRSALSAVSDILGLNINRIPNIVENQDKLLQITYEYRLPLLLHSRDIIPSPEPGLTTLRSISFSFMLQYTNFTLAENVINEPREIGHFYSTGFILTFTFQLFRLLPFDFGIGYVMGLGNSDYTENEFYPRFTDLESLIRSASSINDRQFVFYIKTYIDAPSRSSKGYAPSLHDALQYSRIREFKNELY